MYCSGEAVVLRELGADQALTAVEGPAYHECRWAGVAARWASTARGAAVALSRWSMQGLELADPDFAPSCQ